MRKKINKIFTGRYFSFSIVRKLVAYFLVGLLVTGLTSTQTKLDTLKLELQKDLADTIRINTLLSLADKYSYQNPDSAIFFAAQAKNISEKINDQIRFAKSLRELGWNYYTKGNYPNALKHYFEALEIDKQNNNKKGISNTLGNIGSIYKEQGDYLNALDNYLKSVKIGEELGDKKGQASDFCNIGIVYSMQGAAHSSPSQSEELFNNALDYYFKALKIFEESGNKNAISTVLGNIGIVYMYQSDYSKSLDYYFKALKIVEELGNKNHIAIWIGNIGIVYYEQGNYSKALNYYLKALKTFEELNDKNSITINLSNIGSLYTKMGKFKEAEEHLKQALAIDTAIGNQQHEQSTHKEFSTLYDTLSHVTEGKGQLKKTIEYLRKSKMHFKKSVVLQDTLFSIKRQKDMERLSTNHEWEMKLLQKEQTEKEQARIEVEQRERRNLLQYSAMALGIFALFGVLFSIAKFNVQIWVLELSVFMPFLLLFEFTLVLLDPYIETWTGGEPILKLLINSALAGLIFPLHNFFETLLKKRLLMTWKKINAK